MKRLIAVFGFGVCASAVAAVAQQTPPLKQYGYGPGGNAYTANYIASANQDQLLDNRCIAASASGTAYTCSTAPPSVMTTGAAIKFQYDVANTGAATLAVNGAPAKPIKKQFNVALVANDRLAGQWVTLLYDGTNWEDWGPQSPTAVSPPRVGVVSGTPAAAGNVGEVISSLVPVGSGVSISTATPVVILTLSLTAGDWDVEGSAIISGSGTTIANNSTQEFSVNSGTGCSSPAQVTDGSELFIVPPALTTTSTKFGAAVPKKVFNVSSPTTVCVVATTTFTAGTEVGYGSLIARRVE